MPPKRRRRFQGLYYHSSPPKVMPMNGQISSQNGRKRRDMDDFSVKLSTIRIWMHEKDIGKLTRILWAGQGNRLCQQASTNHKVKRFLAAVPYVMNSIKDVHQAVIDNNLETLQAKLEPPVSPALMTCKDANGLNIVHKAAGLGHTMILEYLIGIWPEGAHETDITGKTPLHWAASAKNNMRCYTLLTQAGCDEEALDYKMKTPTYYRHKPNEIERAFLVYVPEAPRVSPDIMTDWEALSGDDASSGGGDSKKLDLKKLLPTTNGFHGRSHDDSIENTSEVDLIDGVSATEEIEMPKDDEMTAVPIENGNRSQSTAPATPEENHQEEVDEKAEVTQAAADEENNSNDLNETTTTTTTETEATEKVEGNPEEAEDIHEKKESESNGDDEDNDDDSNKKETMKDNEHSDEIVSEDNVKDDEESHDEEEKSVENYAAEMESENNKVTEDDDNEENIAVTASNKSNGDIEENSIEIEVEDTNNDNEVETSETQNESEANNDETQANDKTEEDVNTTNTEEIINDEIEAQKENDNEITKYNGSDKIINQDQETGEKICLKKSDEVNTEDNKEINNEDNKEINNETDDKEEEEEMQQENDVHDKKIKVPANAENTDDAEEDDDENAIVPPAAVNAEDGNDDDDDDDVVEAEPDSDDERLDENHNEGKYDAISGSSPTSSLAIEGFVEGVPEDNTVQSQSAAFVDEELRLQEIVSSGDIGQLAQIVLNGDGTRLLNMHSTEPEVQEFLNNVPRYMSQIRRVHEAAREASMTAFRQALERRKFAISKDEISPNGATPLHVAVLFGNTEIVRYLAEKFPEATAITDNDGRTALHYAATIKDNGHFYNMLTQFGGNSKALDKLGHTPEFYLNDEQAKNILSYRQLLSNFGAEELEEELLSDQGQAENPSYQANPIFKTEQGKYLANNLADPLIKALTEIANKRPEDPVTFLTSFLQNYIHARNPKAKQLNSSSSKSNSTAVMNSDSSSVQKNNNRNANLINSNNDEIEVDRNSVGGGREEEDEVAPVMDERDEHGQSMLHFACARSHRRGGLMHLIEESNMDITHRDELYRTARDVSLQANQPANAKDIDNYVLSLVAVGDLRPFEHLAISGYDHIIDVTDDNGNSITDIAAERGHEELADFFRNLRSLEELREELHQMIRNNNVGRVKEITAASNAQWFLKAKNYYGRTALHIAILKESEEIVELFVKICPETLKIGDNLERTVLHYAMGTNAIENLSRILIQHGAKRTTKDLKGRQPSYYFMNKADILRLQEEEDENR